MDTITFENLLAQGEVQNVEFKGNERFDGDFRAHLAAAIIAFANTSGGGTIVIGIEKDSQRVTGVSPENLRTFDPTDISKYLRERASTLPLFRVERYQHAAGIVLLIQVQEFDEVPIIVTKQIANSKKAYAQVGDILIRTRSSECRRISSVDEMQDLLTRAVMKRSEQLLGQIRIILSGEKPVIPERSPQEQFNELLPNWKEKVDTLASEIGAAARWEIQLLPIPLLTPVINLQSIPELVRRSAVRWRGWRFPQDFERLNFGKYYLDYAEVDIKISNTFGFPHNEFWQMSNRGAFGAASGMWQELVQQQAQFNYPPPPNRLISAKDVCWTITEYFRFVTTIAETLDYGSLWLRIALCNVNLRLLGDYDNPWFGLELKQSYLPTIELMGIFSQAELVSSWRTLAQDWAARMYTAFQFADVSKDHLASLQQDLMSRQY